MPLSSSTVGRETESITTQIDARWLMAYAAALGDMLPRYFDTASQDGVVGHPLFSVGPDWPVYLSSHGLEGNERLSEQERLRGVHYTHDVLNHRLVRPGDQLQTTAKVVCVERRRSGAYQVVRLHSRDADGAPVYTTYYGSLYRGVEVEGADRCVERAAPLPERCGTGREARSASPIPIPASAPHVYTECARIWNPIHTDAAVAERAGLPGLILHGTATLALAVSRVVELEAGGVPERVSRVAGRFGAMVNVPSEISVVIVERRETSSGEAVFFEVSNAEGELAVRDGIALLG
jgi:acyl dehydratase